MNESARNMLEAFQSMQWPEPVTLLFRLYHDDQGRPLFYSQQDLPGKYVDVTPEQYLLANLDVRIESGRLIKPNRKSVKKLTPGESGTCCHPNDVALTVTDVDPHIKWTLK